MNKRNFFFVFVALGISFQCLSQKVKYKDLFILLNSKQYDQAEPFLKRYLKENDDNPNAYLFMAMIYHEKTGKDDVLKSTDQLAQDTDSALYFYALALKGITEKELRRHDEYYQAYNRRDLRTGEFGVKLSDVQFDVEKRTQGLKDRLDRVKQLKAYFQQTELLYSRAMARYKTLTGRYENERAFYLRADDQQSTDLNRLMSAFDSCMVAFNNYKGVLQGLGKTGYNQQLNLIEIRDYAKDGISEPGFMQDDLRLWDYKRWAQNALDAISREIKPIREHLIGYDTEINKLREKLKKDSVSVKNDLTGLVDKILFTQLKKYDPDPMPMQVFGMKIAELEYASEILHSRSAKDSANLQLHVTNTKREMAVLNKLDSLARQLTSRNLEKDAENYKDFIANAYGTNDVLKSLITATREFAEREKIKKSAILKKREEGLKWLVVAKDSIPLVNPASKDTRFKPLVIVNEKYTAGLAYIDSLSAVGYFYTITLSRVPDVKAAFPIDKSGGKKRDFPQMRGLSTADAKGQVYYIGIYSLNKVKEKYPLTIAKIYRSDGLAWSTIYALDGVPSEMIFNADTGELSVKILIGTAGESKLVVIDKNGKLIR